MLLKKLPFTFTATPSHHRKAKYLLLFSCIFFIYVTPLQHCTQFNLEVKNYIQEHKKDTRKKLKGLKEQYF